MKKIITSTFLKAVWLFSILFLPNALSAQNLTINEFMASNGNSIQDEAGEFEDWVEIYNGENFAVDLAGYYLTDNLAEPNLHQIPFDNTANTTIPAGGYLIFWFDKDLDQGPLHVDAKLSSGGEAIGLFAPDGVTEIDSYEFGIQIESISEGREMDGTGDFDYFLNPTPGSTNNNSTPGVTQTNAPSIFPSGGLYTSNQTVSMSSDGGSQIYYTLDGTTPDDGSTLYTGPITVAANTPLRAVAIAPAELPSIPQTETYLFNTNHTFAVVSVVADPDVLFDPETGMYPNFLEDIEKPANVEMFEPNGTQAFSQLIELEISGTASAFQAQKSLAVKAKGSLGGSTIDYPIFPGGEYDAYRSLVLRNSGQDWNYTMFHDAMVSGLVREDEDVSEVIEPANLNHQDYRPGVVYINGEYWGIHNIRERTDKRYVRVHFGWDDDEIDLLDDFNEVKEGSIDKWDEMQNYVLTNDLSGSASLQTLNSFVDIDAYLDNIVFNLYVDNADWPSNNNRRFRNLNGSFQWMIKDLDFSYGFFQHYGGYNTGDPSPNSLARLLYGTGANWPNAEWSTRLFRGLIQNDQWRYDFINRMADQINVYYDKDRMLNRIDEYEQIYEPEMQQHLDRWADGYNIYADHVNKLRIFANGRTDVVYQHFTQEFPEVNGTANLTINASPAVGGTVKISTINAGSNFQGTWFTGIPVPAQAIAAPGYVFTGWSGVGNGNDANTSFTFFGNGTLTANFSPDIGCEDNDNDGFCANVDCNDFDPNLPATPGSPCNDSNPNTENDVYEQDGCTCSGTPIGGGGDCDDINISTSGSTINISGLTAPNEIVKIFDLQNGWNVIFSCTFDCNSSESLSNLANGNYIVSVAFYDAAYQLICTEEQTVSINGSCPDTDGDGICDGDDCEPNNSTLPTAPGTGCDDFNSQTENDVIQQDGCTCQGTPINGGGACNGSTTNLALNKSATQSSTLNFQGFPSADLAVDGNLDGNYFNGSVAATENSFQGWWEVDLGEISTIESVEVYNRTDGQDRLFDCYVLVSDTPFTAGANLAIARDQAIYEQFISGQVGSPSTILTNDIEGRYVRIHKLADGYVTLAEVVVNGCTDGGGPIGGGNLPCGLDYTSTQNSITITGFNNAPHSIFKLFTNSYSIVDQCVDCNDPYLIGNLSAGNYIVAINTYDENWNPLCEDQAPVSIVQEFNVQDIKTQYYITDLFPNPAIDELIVRLNSQINADDITLEIYDLTGGIKIRKEISIEKGNNTLLLDISILESGMYNMIIQGSNSRISTTRFAKIEK